MSTVTVRGAREHNLRSLDLDLPRDQLVVFCGVSGSGKSSLAFDTLHAEGQRRYLEALALHRRGAVPELQQPRVDTITGLPPTIALSQRFAPPSARFTVGVVSETDAVLRVLFGRTGTLRCPLCGRPVRVHTHDEIVADLMARPSGTRLTLEAPVTVRDDAAGVIDEVVRAGFSRIRVGDDIVRLDELDPSRLDPDVPVRIVVDRVRLADDRRSRLYDSVRTTAQAGRGVVVAQLGDEEVRFVDRPFCPWDELPLPALEPRLLSYLHPGGACTTCGGSGEQGGEVCPDCGGSRLGEVARAVRWRTWTWPELQALPVAALLERLREVRGDEVEEVALRDLRRRLERLVDLGLGHLALGRSAGRLAASEVQRLRLARQVASPLSGVLYVLDEPTAGLAADDVQAVLRLMRALVAQGNGVLAVEHDAAVIRAADHVVEFGPGAGGQGGRITYSGDVAGLLAGDTVTARWLTGREQVPERPPVAPRGHADVRGLRFRGLEGLDLRLPLGALGAITGPSGSGKSSVLDALEAWLGSGSAEVAGELSGVEGLGRVVVVGGTPARSSRSMPATYTGLWDVVRELLAATREAQVRGFDASTFSLNTRGGRCEACQGTGERRVELDLLPEVVLPCPVCDGRRFDREVLEVRWKGHSAADLLELRAEEAWPVLSGHPRLDPVLRALVRVGLGYLPLGQPVSTLSGGEARRLRLARELARAGRRGAEDTVYLLDDPTIGLHPADVAVLVELLRDLVREGATVWVATHDLHVVDAADEVIRLPGR